jgi:hypothetical protein
MFAGILTDGFMEGFPDLTLKGWYFRPERQLPPFLRGAVKNRCTQRRKLRATTSTAGRIF